MICLRNITQFGSVSVLGTESHVFKSHYFESLFLNKIANKLKKKLFKKKYI